MLDNQFNFSVENDKVKVTFKRSVPIPDFLQVVLTGTLNAMQQIVNTTPESDKERVKGELYDMFNAGASRTLEYFAPELELRPDLTTQAILEAEDRIMDRTIAARKKKNAKSKRV